MMWMHNHRVHDFLRRIDNVKTFKRHVEKSLDGPWMKTLRKKRNGIFIIMLGVMLTACGGGGSSDSSPSDLNTPAEDVAEIVYAGEFIGPVEGLGYRCSGDAISFTDTNGKLICQEDDDVTFYLGAFKLGSAVVDSAISPNSLYPDDTDAAIDIARLITTLDSDDNISNGIVIDDVQTALLETCDIKPGSIDFESAIASYIGEDLVSEAQARRLYDFVSYSKVATLTKIVDGDTLYFDDVKCRIAYIDSPESTRNVKAKSDTGLCEELSLDTMVEMGKQSTLHAEELVQIGDPYRYDVIGTDRYSRSVCIVHTPNGIFDELMVKQGYAVPYERYIPQSLKRKYDSLATEAKQSERGLWEDNALECLGRE